MPRGVKLVNSLIFSVSCRLLRTPMLGWQSPKDRIRNGRQNYHTVYSSSTISANFGGDHYFWKYPMRISLVPSSETTSVPTTPRWKEGACRQVSPRMRRRRVPGRIALLSGLGMSRARQPRAEFNRASLPVLPRWIKVAAAVRINSSLRWVLCRPDTRYGVGVAGGSCFGLDCCSLLLANMGLYDSELRQQGISLPYAGLL